MRLFSFYQQASDAGEMHSLVPATELQKPNKYERCQQLLLATNLRSPDRTVIRGGGGGEGFLKFCFSLMSINIFIFSQNVFGK
jgi:hypothetical protein